MSGEGGGHELLQLRHSVLAGFRAVWLRLEARHPGPDKPDLMVLISTAGLSDGGERALQRARQVRNRVANPAPDGPNALPGEAELQQTLANLAAVNGELDQQDHQRGRRPGGGR